MILKIQQKPIPYTTLEAYADAFKNNAEADSPAAINPSVTITKTPFTIGGMPAFKLEGCDSYCGIMTTRIFFEKDQCLYELSYQYTPAEKLAALPNSEKVNHIEILQNDITRHTLIKQILPTFEFLPDMQ